MAARRYAGCTAGVEDSIGLGRSELSVMWGNMELLRDRSDWKEFSRAAAILGSMPFHGYMVFRSFHSPSFEPPLNRRLRLQECPPTRCCCLWQPEPTKGVILSRGAYPRVEGPAFVVVVAVAVVVSGYENLPKGVFLSGGRSPESKSLP